MGKGEKNQKMRGELEIIKDNVRFSFKIKLDKKLEEVIHRIWRNRILERQMQTKERRQHDDGATVMVLETGFSPKIHWSDNL